MTPKTQKLINELRQWCDASPRYGKRIQAAAALGISPQTITNWFGGRQNPTSEQVLDLQDFLKKKSKQPRRKNPPNPNKPGSQEPDADSVAEGMEFE